MHTTKKNHGFTLLELSIVLTIIALILGGIMTGRSLLRNAHLRHAVVEAQQYIQSVSAFRDKYMALPGDFAGGNAMWGSPAAGNCDGNGDGRVTNQGGATNYGEQFCAWWHLVQAGLVEGNFTLYRWGKTVSQDRVPGSNVPASQVSGAGWGIITLDALDAATSADITYSATDIPPNTVLWFGGRSVTGTSNQMAGVIAPDEAATMDQKIDDGLPNMGKLVIQKNALGSACDNSNAYNYAVSDNVWRHGV